MFSAESNNEEWVTRMNSSRPLLIIHIKKSKCHRMKMNAQCSLYNVHGLTCNIDCPKNTSVHFFPHPPMTVKMSLTSPCVHCPIADGTRLHPLHRNHHKMLHIAKPGHKFPQKLQPGCKKISLSCGFWGTRSDNISSNLWIWEEVFVRHHLHVSTLSCCCSSVWHLGK